MVNLIKGFKDILPDESALWQHVENRVHWIFGNFGFRDIRLPILEKTELFRRSIGQDTDIVEKEMYTFPDRKGNLVTMRPEATASAVRSYIQHKLYAKEPVQKLYTIGPMFRRERPQKGRYRQFYQINAEAFGVESPLLDAQMIFMLTRLFDDLKITGTTAHVNSLGCSQCRPSFKKALGEYLEPKHDALCDNCKRRRNANPLRVLDCKVPSCRDLISDAPDIIDFLCDDCARHFKIVLASLEKLGVAFKINKRLVRGLDYYTRTTFEIQTESLGAQNALAGGGRYDGLVESLGGPPMPAIGFAIGFDRLVEILNLKSLDMEKGPDIFMAALGDEAMEKAFEWASRLSISGIKTEMDFSGRSLKSLMKRADRLRAENVIMIGDREIKEGRVVLRNMKTREQLVFSMDNLLENIKMTITNTTNNKE